MTHPMAHTHCMHGVALDRECFDCWKNSEAMKRDMIRRIDAELAKVKSAPPPKAKRRAA